MDKPKQKLIDAISIGNSVMGEEKKLEAFIAEIQSCIEFFQHKDRDILNVLTPLKKSVQTKQISAEKAVEIINYMIEKASDHKTENKDLFLAPAMFKNVFNNLSEDLKRGDYSNSLSSGENGANR